MTDLEICKRIAEIDGVDCSDDDLYFRYWKYQGAPVEPYNPLTDDALNHQLMIKYKVDIMFNDEWCGIYNDYNTKGVLFEDISPNKAICLAIIEAHN
jgi:hypothetical protein